MENTPLIQLFRTLSKQERRELKQWVNSPFVNKREDVSLLFEYLNKHIPTDSSQVDPSNLKKERAYPHVFPASTGAYSDANMRYAMSFLFQAVKQFLSYQQWMQNEYESGRMLCQSLQRRNLDQLFEKEYAALSTQVAQSRFKSVDFFFQQYHLHMERWEVFRRSNRSASDILELAGAARDAYIASETLRSACAVLTQPGSHKKDIDSIYLQASLAGIESGKFQENPAVLAYYHCFMVLSDQNESTSLHFQELSVLLREQWHLFPPKEIRDLYIGAINYCIRRLNSGDRKYIAEALHLYKSGLDRKVILEDGMLNKYTYNNIMLLALGSDDWDWAWNFLEEYKSALPPKDRENAWRYNVASYHFRKKEYDKAQKILIQVEFRDTFYNLDSRRMLVRIYMDTGEYNALESLLESFSTYLQRKQSVLGYYKDLNLNFVKFVKRIQQLKQGNKEEREKLREKIKATQYVAEKEWLLGKI